VGDGPSLVRTRPTLPLTSIGSNASNIALSWSAHQAERGAAGVRDQGGTNRLE